MKSFIKNVKIVLNYILIYNFKNCSLKQFKIGLNYFKRMQQYTEFFLTLKKSILSISIVVKISFKWEIQFVLFLSFVGSDRVKSFNRLSKQKLLFRESAQIISGRFKFQEKYVYSSQRCR